MNDLHSQVEIISSDLERAQEVQENLNTQFPSFVKTMIRSNVTHGFWLSLPKLFCDLYLPTCDIKVTLVDESRKEYYTKYLADRRGLSAGWRGFSIAHNLEEGDVLVFHLIEACKMKVYIVRAHRFGAVDAALSLLHLQAHAELVNNGEHLKQDDGDIPLVIEKILRPLSQGMPHDNFENVVRSSKSKLVTNHTQNFSKDLAMALEGHQSFKLTTSPRDFTFWNKRSTTFQCFQIIIGQIRAQLDQFACLVLDSRNTSIPKSRENDELEEDFGDELVVFKVKVQELKESTQRLYDETEVLRVNAEIHKLNSRKNLA
ncbi:hypothetical protein RD792_016248 [Penstemon davidsonii]|uniref:TF-B3 domain-containing protein n=1 Tax=Penstemon davidsonii TaxID=160366 RepID=A0ABR0CIS3_9LAMI|nr:hypothetical protein RD792_016248 [Penstemon davidsonii]